jgi:succinyl-diaminopimelate desuccinylase
LTFTVRTAGAHGAYTHRSEGANRVAAALIADLSSVEKIIPHMPPDLVAHLQRPDVRAAIDTAMGAGAADIMGRPTLNIGVIHGGLKVNMIPDLCIFEADIRLPIGLDKQPVMEHIHSILKAYPHAEVKIQDAASNPPNYCAHDHPMVEIIARNAETTTGARPVAIPSLGATDSKYWRYINVPAYVFGPAPGRMGTTDESVALDEFMAVLKTHVLSAWDYLGGHP